MSRNQLLIAILSASLLFAVLLIAVRISLPDTPADSNTENRVKDPVVSEMISRINESNIYDTVYDLTAFTTRRLGTTGNTEAKTYLFNRLSSISGLNVEYQGSYNNIIATLPGTNTSSNEIYIIGGHYDSKVYPVDSITLPAPGATDNAGGAALIVELARVMSEYRFRHTIKFALWNGEEDGTKGSAQYAQMAHDSNLKISFYLNLDAACYYPYNRFILDIMYNDQSHWISNIMAEYNTLYSIGFSLTYNVHDCTSDHREFWNRGYTAIATHQEVHVDFVHTASDTIDKVSTSYAKRNGQLAILALVELAEFQGN
jgi:leucyl aminopeptidase